MADHTERLDFRLTAANKRLIEQAAMLLGQPLTAFAIRVLVERAEQVIDQETQRKLSARDFKRFMEELDDDRVSPALAKAAKRYKASKKASPQKAR